MSDIDSQHPRLVPVDLYAQLRQIVLAARLDVGRPRGRADNPRNIPCQLCSRVDIKAPDFHINGRTGTEVQQEPKNASGADKNACSGDRRQLRAYVIDNLELGALPPPRLHESHLDIRGMAPRI